jgi:rhamnose utilization protein RhaD (predicted bifunctional aldolase and dehydrogenase)
MFTAIFDILKELTGKAVNILHIHGSGWSTIIGDLDQAQAKGLGLALNSIDRSKSWEQHLISIFKSCIIHFNR